LVRFVFRAAEESRRRDDAAAEHPMYALLRELVEVVRDHWKQ
jgi:hypothetical protein